MFRKALSVGMLTGISCIAAAQIGQAQDWPQWRGPNRDGKATFAAPETWPKDIEQKWQIKVGDGVASPALVGDKLYVFTRQDGNEILRCLNAADGQEIWQDKYEADAPRGGAAGFPGPRATPTVADGKVVAFGAQGTLSCYDAAVGKLLWRKTEYEGKAPRFATSSSPIIQDNLAIVQVGSERDGGIVAFDLASGDEKWKWTGDGPAYGSPVAIQIGDTKAIITPTDKNMVILAAADGKLLWKIGYEQGRYNAATPIVDGQTIIYAGPTRGSTAQKIEKQGEELEAKPLWTNSESSMQFVTPVLKDGLVFGISNLNSVFCIDTENGKTIWNAPLSATASGGERPAGERPAGDRPEAQRPGGERPREGQARPGGRGPGGFGGPGGRGGRGGGRGGYGSVVDAGSVLFALVPTGELTVFVPGKEFKKLASYKVAERGAYAYPVVSGKRIFIKDQDALTLWQVP
jgi:outer membrane protein assembly factor BamB